jgi:purine-binding chemotaxis protein CheW
MRQPNVKQSTINWEQVRERLRASEHALEEALAENPARIQAAYRKRATQLANGQAGNETRLTSTSVLLFSLRQERYAVELSELAEVLPLARCTSVPGAAPAFVGVINLRGELRPVVDLARIILRAENAAAVSGFVLMLRRSGREIGLKVDQLEGLLEIARDTADSPEQGKYTKRIAGETMLLIDVERVLAKVFSEEELLTT